MGWWINIRELGRQKRLRLAPAHSKSAPMLAASPMQHMSNDSGLFFDQRSPEKQPHRLPLYEAKDDSPVRSPVGDLCVLCLRCRPSASRSVRHLRLCEAAIRYLEENGEQACSPRKSLNKKTAGRHRKL